MCATVINDQHISLEAKPDPKVFKFDYVADTETTQNIVFDECAQQIADACLEGNFFILGYNGTIFAYGQTGAGKTYTIQGPEFEEWEQDLHSNEKAGIMPWAFDYLFTWITELQSQDSDNEVEFLIKGSYLEIYNE